MAQGNSRMLGRQQRQRFKRIKQNRGVEAARGYRQKIGERKGLLSQPEETPTETPVADEPVTADPPPQANLPTDTTAPVDNSEALFPHTRAFEPKNYEGSPLYQFQAKEGQKRLDRKMASLGLTNSGADIEATSQFLTGLGAQEAQRQQGVAQQEADRLERIQQAEAQRRERGGNEQWDRTYGILQLMAGQSPMNNAYSAAQNTANLQTDFAKDMAGYMQQNVPQSSGGGYGGSGGSSYTPSPYPFPQINYGAADQLSILNSAANSQGYADLLNNYAGGLFNYGSKATK